LGPELSRPMCENKKRKGKPLRRMPPNPVSAESELATRLRQTSVATSTLRRAASRTDRVSTWPTASAGGYVLRLAICWLARLRVSAALVCGHVLRHNFYYTPVLERLQFVGLPEINSLNSQAISRLANAQLILGQPDVSAASRRTRVCLQTGQRPPLSSISKRQSQC
jgi:hypothetical protein